MEETQESPPFDLLRIPGLGAFLRWRHSRSVLQVPLLLITQATMHHNFWGSPVPVSVLQLVFPRVELHLFYNTIVFIPMVIGMYYHMFPPAGEGQHDKCSCAWHERETAACAA